MTQHEAKRPLADMRSRGGIGLSFLLFSALFLAGLDVMAVQAEAQALYGYRSRNGAVTFTTRKPDGKSYWLVRPRRPVYSKFITRSGVRATMRPTPSKYDALIKEMAASYMLEPALVKAVVHAESAFNPKARSHAGAMGLMQLMPATAQRFKIDKPYSPIDNIVGGVRYLRWLFDRFDGNVAHVLAGYNAGEGAVDRYKGIPPYSETQTYVKRVMKLRDSYRCDYHGRKKC